MTLEKQYELEALLIIHKNAPILKVELNKMIDNANIPNRMQILEEFHRKDYIEWRFEPGFESNRHPLEGLQEYLNKRAETAKVILNPTGARYMEHLLEEKNIGTLEVQKLHGEVDIISSKLFDYDATKKRAKWARILAWIAIGLTALES